MFLMSFVGVMPHTLLGVYIQQAIIRHLPGELCSAMLESKHASLLWQAAVLLAPG